MPSFEEASLGLDVSGSRSLTCIAFRKQSTFRKTFTLDHIVHVRFGLNIAIDVSVIGQSCLHGSPRCT